MLNTRKTKRHLNRSSFLWLLQLHPNPVPSRLLLILLSLYQSLPLFSEYKAKLWPKICKLWGATLYQSMCSWPSDFPELKHHQCHLNWNSSQTFNHQVQQSVDCKHTDVQKKKQPAHWDSWGAQYVYKYLMLNPANWGSGGDVHRTHPVPPLSKLWAHWLSATGEGMGRKQQGTQGQKRMRKAGKDKQKLLLQ